MGITQSVKRSVQQNPEGQATAFGTRTRSWRDFADRVARLAGGLRSLGLEPGDRLPILNRVYVRAGVRSGALGAWLRPWV